MNERKIYHENNASFDAKKWMNFLISFAFAFRIALK